MNTSSITVRYDHVLSEHLAADRLYYRSTRLSKLDRVVAIALVALGGFLTYSAGVRWWTVFWFPLAIVEWFNLLSPRPIQIWYWFTHNPKMRETYQLTFEDAGIHFQTISIDSRINWSHFTSLLENDKMCLLVHGPRMYSVIPKRVFESESDFAAFRAMAHAKIPHVHHDA